MNCLTSLVIGMVTTFMPTLPYPHDALAPIISEETIDLHYGKHLQTYVSNLEKLIKDTEFEGMNIGEIVQKAPVGPMYNNAGQVLNHQLYFLQFTPNPRINVPEGKLAVLIDRDFGNFDAFRQKMTDASIGLFGSGWVWLCVNHDGKLEILSCVNGDNPLRQGKRPLLGFDVWEHAYYLDYQNRRAEHLNLLWNIINWDEIANRLDCSDGNR